MFYKSNVSGERKFCRRDSHCLTPAPLSQQKVLVLLPDSVNLRGAFCLRFQENWRSSPSFVRVNLAPMRGLSMTVRVKLLTNTSRPHIPISCNTQVAFSGKEPDCGVGLEVDSLPYDEGVSVCVCVRESFIRNYGRQRGGLGSPRLPSPSAFLLPHSQWWSSILHGEDLGGEVILRLAKLSKQDVGLFKARLFKVKEVNEVFLFVTGGRGRDCATPRNTAPPRN